MTLRTILISLDEAASGAFISSQVEEGSLLCSSNDEEHPPPSIIDISDKYSLCKEIQLAIQEKESQGYAAMPLDLHVFGAIQEESGETEFILYSLLKDLASHEILVKIFFHSPVHDLEWWKSVAFDAVPATSNSSINHNYSSIWRSLLSLSVSFTGSVITGESHETLVPIQFESIGEEDGRGDFRRLSSIKFFRLYSLHQMHDCGNSIPLGLLTKADFKLFVDADIVNLFSSMTPESSLAIISSMDFDQFILWNFRTNLCHHIIEPVVFFNSAYPFISHVHPRSSYEMPTYFKSCRKWSGHVNKKKKEKEAGAVKKSSDSNGSANKRDGNHLLFNEKMSVYFEKRSEKSRTPPLTQSDSQLLENRNKQSIKKIIYLALHMKGITQKSSEFTNLYRHVYERVKSTLQPLLDYTTLSMERITSEVHKHLQ